MASSSTGSKAIPQLANLLMFGDNPSGEIFYVNADNLPKGGQDAIRRILFNDKGASKTLLSSSRRRTSRRETAGDARRPALRRGPERPDFHAEQAGWSDTVADQVASSQ